MSLLRKTWIFTILFGFLPILVAYNNCAPMSAKVQGALETGSDGGNGGVPGTGGGLGGNGGNGGLPGATEIPADATEGEIFFLTTVVPKINSSSCVTCHTAPRFAAMPAPLELFNYDLMLLKLAQGNSASNNGFINKPLGAANHGGGNQCPGGPFSDPCKTFTDWAKVEFPTLANGASGALTSLSSRGLVSGWAVDSVDQNAVLDVHIYADGPAGSGVFLATVAANQTGLGGTRAGHYFVYQLPASFANGDSHTLYIYGDTPDAANLLPGMPVNYTAYTPSTQGIAYFNQSVAPALNACVGCHSISIDAQFASLLTPTPANGGSATNNSLVIKGSGGNGHGGGNICGGPSGSPCAQIQQWWNIEFGP